MHRTMIATSTMLLALATNAVAQDWPTRPMTLVVPFSAGGGVDVSARIQAQRMGELLGQFCKLSQNGEQVRQDTGRFAQ